MARPRKAVPSYRLHTQSGQGIVTLTDLAGNRRDVLLGAYKTPESLAEYHRVVAEWEASNRRLPEAGAKGDLSVNELALAYYRFAEGYYRKNGKPTSQLDRVACSLTPVKELYGHTLGREFGPLALKAIRKRMVDAGWTRGFINSCIGCIKRMFKWAVADELLPSSVYHGLLAVEGLKRGRCHAVESKPVRPVADEHVDAALPFLTKPLQAMVQVQFLTGMRPGEACLMRPCDIDRSNPKVWVYRPESHKTEHHGIARSVFIGPRAQIVLRPFLFRDPGAYLFSAKEGMAEFRCRQRTARKSKVQPSHEDRSKRNPRKSPRLHYSVDSYNQSVARAIKRANTARACEACKPLKQANRCAACKAKKIPHWHVNQLRHAKATEIRKEAGLDAARAVLGHHSPAITEVYAELDMGKAAAIMERLG